MSSENWTFEGLKTSGKDELAFYNSMADNFQNAAECPLRKPVSGEKVAIISLHDGQRVFAAEEVAHHLASIGNDPGKSHQVVALIQAARAMDIPIPQPM